MPPNERVSSTFAVLERAACKPSDKANVALARSKGCISNPERSEETQCPLV